MLRHNVENQSNEDDGVELSRRSFFGRLAVGAFLSIGMPGVVYAAKSAAVKAEKTNVWHSQPRRRSGCLKM
jgi:hypothetical protein